LDLIRREGGMALKYRLEMIRFFDDNENSLAGLDLDETLAAILKWRYRDQPSRFEWGYNPDALKQQDRWQEFSTGELKSLKQTLDTAESTLDEMVFRSFDKLKRRSFSEDRIPDDRSTPSGWSHPFSAGGAFLVYLHLPVWMIVLVVVLLLR
jgi:hypothetical protein